MRRAPILGAALAMMAAAPAVAAPPPPAVNTARLADGTMLVHVPLPGTDKVSLRWVVGSGGAADPPGMAGLAHLLEHLVFHGSYTVSESKIFDDVHEAGGYLNAFTTPDMTYYVLDAPAARFPALASMFIGVITTPALTLAELERERGVVATEGMLRPGEGMMWVADQLIFSAVERGATVIGTKRSRERIARTDLAKFYAEHYIPSNTTVIITGDITLEAARKLVEESTRLPPDLPEDRADEKIGEANLPLTEKTFAPWNVTLYGYELDGVDRSTCREVASLLELRLMRAAEIDRPLASSIRAICYRLRGHDFLFVMSVSRSYEGGALPDVLRDTFTEATKRGPTAEERDLMRSRGQRAAEALIADPAALAEALVPEVASLRGSDEKRGLQTVMLAPQLDAAALVRAARKSFTEERRVEIRLSPFGG